MYLRTLAAHPETLHQGQFQLLDLRKSSLMKGATYLSSSKLSTTYIGLPQKMSKLLSCDLRRCGVRASETKSKLDLMLGALN